MRTTKAGIGLLLCAFAVAEARADWHRATLDTGEVSIPFLVDVPAPGEERPAVIRNGDERIEVACRWNGDAVTLDFPHYDSRIVATRSTDRTLQGAWTKMRPSGDAVLAFAAEPVDEASPLTRFDVDAERADADWTPDEDELRYRVNFERSGLAEAVLEPTGPVRVGEGGAPLRAVTGTVLTPTGDYRFLSGVYEPGRRLRLSVFDGAHAFLIDASIDMDSGGLDGTFYSGAHWREPFTAQPLRPGETVDLPDPFSQIGLEPGVTRLNLPRLDEPPYAGSPTIVTVFGTWCPNCHDEAPLLVDLYERHADNGLEMLGLSFEYTDDPERSRRQIERFKARYGIEWEVAAAGVSDKSKAARALPALTDVKSYPTTIWINPDGTVHAIHSGFSGPATGEAHERTVEAFERLTREIVNRR